MLTTTFIYCIISECSKNRNTKK